MTWGQVGAPGGVPRFQPRQVDAGLWQPPARKQAVALAISGSFHHENWKAVKQAVEIAVAGGHRVLSPNPDGMRKVDRRDEFDFLEGDSSRSKRETQLGHLEAIARSDLLWIATPDGYIGSSTSMEIGYAIASATPVFARKEILDDTLCEFVSVVRGISSAAKRVLHRRSHQIYSREPDLEAIHRLLDEARRLNTRPARSIGDREARILRRVRYMVEASQIP